MGTGCVTLLCVLYPRFEDLLYHWFQQGDHPTGIVSALTNMTKGSSVGAVNLKEKHPGWIVNPWQAKELNTLAPPKTVWWERENWEHLLSGFSPEVKVRSLRVRDAIKSCNDTILLRWGSFMDSFIGSSHVNYEFSILSWNTDRHLEDWTCDVYVGYWSHLWVLRQGQWRAMESSPGFRVEVILFPVLFCTSGARTRWAFQVGIFLALVYQFPTPATVSLAFFSPTVGCPLVGSEVATCCSISLLSGLLPMLEYIFLISPISVTKHTTNNLSSS